MKKPVSLFGMLLISLILIAQDTTLNPYTKSPKGILTASTIGLVVPYTATILLDVTNAGLDFPECVIPGIGPFIALFRYESYVGDTYSYKALDKAGFAVSGIVQSLSIAGLAIGMTKLSKYDVNKFDKTKYLTIASAIGLAVPYTTTIILDINNKGLDFPEIFVPGVGPLIALVRYDSYVSEQYPNKRLEKIEFAASGIVQSISIIGLVKNIKKLTTHRKSLKSPETNLSIVPNALGGVTILYTF